MLKRSSYVARAERQAVEVAKFHKQLQQEEANFSKVQQEKKSTSLKQAKEEYDERESQIRQQIRNQQDTVQKEQSVQEIFGLFRNWPIPRWNRNLSLQW